VKLLVVSAAWGLGCGHSAGAPDAPIIDGSRETCTPFSVSGPGGQSPGRPAWTGSEWAIGRPGLYTRIEEAGTLTTMPLPDLTDEPLAWDGVELGFYAKTPTPHIALFTPGHISTLHDAPPIGTPQASETGDVAPDPSGAARIQALFSDMNTTGHPIANRGWSDGTVSTVSSFGTESGPLAWNGDVFITAEAGTDTYYDASFQPVVTRADAVPAGDVIGIAATKRRALVMLTSSSADVEYVQ